MTQPGGCSERDFFSPVDRVSAEHSARDQGPCRGGAVDDWQSCRCVYSHMGRPSIAPECARQPDRAMEAVGRKT